MHQHLTLDERDGILVARMNRPRSRNALSLALMQEFTEFAHGCEARDAVRVIVLAGGAEARAHEIARAAAALPQTAVRLTKKTANAAASALLHLGSHMAADQFAFLNASEEGRIARAWFTQMKKP